LPPSPAIAVVGSINLDLVARAERLPRPGETLTDATFERIPGGKGANQALAAARLGASVRLVGAVGDDPFADEALVLLREGGVDLEGVRRVPDTTGVALILVGGDGENEIVVAPGANRSAEAGDVSGADAVLCQLEIPVETVAEAARQARFFCLNAAPARELLPDLLGEVDLLVVNRYEL
jgi:ribokinase